MKVSLKWLREYVPVTLSTPELSHKLSMSGNEVEGIDKRGGDWDGVRVAQIIKIEKHPNADRLSLATIDLGTEQITLVTGAPNIEVGQKVPYAPVGTRLIDGYTGEMKTLKPAKIRGIDSAGMVCSAKELGLGDDHTGILILAESAPVGAPLLDLFGDTVLDIKTTPNRPDTLSMLGIAWEVAAITGEQVKSPDIAFGTAGEPVNALFTVRIDDPDLCGRYQAGLIRGVKIGESPDWMKERLLAAGMRPINNVVDITNYVMLEYGQPLHAFDAAKIAGNTVIIRRAKDGERLITLDGKEQQLNPSMLVIADTENPIALAGVMGGLNSEVTEATQDILLESASFHNITIRKTATALRMRSEASLRFEKGISPAMTDVGLRRAIQLMCELAGGTAAPGIIDEYPGKQEPATLELSEADVERVLGIRWAASQLRDTFLALGFAVEMAGETLRLTPPFWRTDIRLTEDLVEEVARVIGYDELPATLLEGAIPATPPDPSMVAAEAARDVLIAAGLQEVITYPLVGPDLVAKLGLPDGALGPEPLALVNPLSAELAVMRTSPRPRMLDTLEQNLRHEDDGVGLFEVGPVFLPRKDDLPEERRIVAGIVAGSRGRLSWLDRPGAVDFFDGKGIVEAVFGRFRVDATFSRSTDPFFHPGRAAAISVGAKQIGVVGEVHPQIAPRFDIKATVVYFELELAALLGAPIATYVPVTRYPEVVQDLAFVVDSALEAESLRRVLASGKWVRDVRLFDVYTGQPLPSGKKSLAFTMRFQAPDRTLTDDEVTRVRNGLIERLKRQYAAELRG